MIRSTRHEISASNPGKLDLYDEFIEEYSRVALIVLDMMWERLPSDLNLPKFLDYNTFDVQTNLSARVMSAIVTQVSGIIRGVIKKQRDTLWVQENRNPNVKDRKFSKPEMSFIEPEIASLCCDVQKSPKGKFWGFVQFKSLGKHYGTFSIPIIKVPRMGDFPRAGVKLFKRKIQLAWDLPTKPVERGEKILGIDTGIKSVVALSDGQLLKSRCPHGHSYETILDKVSRKRKGSKAFRKAVAHRKNFARWTINQIDFRGVKEVRLEKVVNIRYGRKSSRKMSHWSHPEIRDKVISRCGELEVPVVEQPSAYRSQRCSQCGHVRKANRKGKVYKCKSCGHSSDADINAALNHVANLPPIPFGFTAQRLNLGKGFFWKPEGFFSFDGAELLVPLDARTNG